ncbi:MAG: hypothetical protein PHS49_01495 [Candidatus Gracilibacteria bacterium]|nr:hypothetical protein [Candidatus Gracilibacteria bacterium]
MGDIIGLGRFPAHDKKTHENLMHIDLPENVKQIPTLFNTLDTLDKEIDEFQNNINLIILSIIENGVLDYLDTTHQSNTQKNKRKLNKDTELVFDTMREKADIIDDTIDYIENTLDEFLTGDFVLRSIGDILSVYRDEVFELLMKKYVDKSDEENTFNSEDIILIDEEEKQKQFDNIIESIINNGIGDYLYHIKQLNTPLIRNKYLESTNHLYEKMLNEANIIDDTIIYLEDEVNMSFYDSFIYGAVSDLLSYYRKEVFDFLVGKYGVDGK